eukprot:gnl/TRDRNA2_/TRDRNA2_132775_c0_seq1.p1 gnl/TRDRNA2_/TRDRNA2_132775_c0~~gnl/TRDRNA2_/TRDRNA2_132775_c0_seq1.p1  ORF type:complete len:505 (+),score=190.84 gnl/TRDRNA2_/TRDRNA2_132775_c0_seq1:89-1603(+)
MAAVMGIQSRSDRAIIQRQKKEAIWEKMVAGQEEHFMVNCKAQWCNKTDGVVRQSRVQSKVDALRAQAKASLTQRREKLAKMLAEEQRGYESEMVEAEETAQQRMDRMAVRAYDLKKKREDERKAFVQEKLYQQWRAGIDELRTQDSKIIQLKTIAARDRQLDEKEELKDDEKRRDKVFDQLWYEGYLAKIEREEREKHVKGDRQDQTKRMLAMQLVLKDEKQQAELEVERAEQAVMKKQWAAQEQEEKDAAVQSVINARLERKKADEYAAIQKAQKDEEARLEFEFDKNFVNGVLAREKALSDMEEAEKAKAKLKSIEYTEALKLEMARKAESEADLIRMQEEESERQWQKRYEQWEKEELARRALMEEVYADRAEQVRLKQGMREALKGDIEGERAAVDAEVRRLEAIEKEREIAEGLVMKRNQEELFRQMDFHQVQRHRQLQQFQIEQRQSAIQEEKIKRAVKAECKKGEGIMDEVLKHRAQQQEELARKKQQRMLAPWEK